MREFAGAYANRFCVFFSFVRDASRTGFRLVLSTSTAITHAAVSPLKRTTDARECVTATKISILMMITISVCLLTQKLIFCFSNLYSRQTNAKANDNMTYCLQRETRTT